MQIRLTVALAPRGGRGAGSAASPRQRDTLPPGAVPGAAPGAPGAGRANVLVTAPVGTVLAAVTGALATTAASAVSAGSSVPSGSTGSAGATGSPGSPGSGGAGEGGGGDGGSQEPVVVYAGTQRLDPHRQIIGEPPLLDGALVSLHGPVTPAALPAHGAAVSAYGSAKARLHVVAGPDAGGIHLLQGGKVHLGRSADADVPLDDPDVSRLHCAVTVTDGGAVTVTDLGSTNGTSIDGSPVGARPVLFQPGSALRIGETAIRLEAAGDTSTAAGSASPLALPTAPDSEGRLRVTRSAPEARDTGRPDATAPPAAPSPATSGPMGPTGPAGPTGPTTPATGTWYGGPAQEPPAPQEGPGSHAYAPAGPFPGDSGTHGSGFASPPPPEADRRRGRGLGAWARRFATGRTEPGAGPGEDAGPYSAEGLAPHPFPAGAAGPPPARLAPHEWDQRWPDPATVLLTALGPGPRLWERAPGHPDALTVRLGSAHRGGGHGEPVTVDLRTSGALGLAGPRARLAGLTRSVLAQLTALHGPSALEVVLLSSDRARATALREEEWSWLGWLPHVRPGHGQDCGLLMAYDREQAAARTAELLRRLDTHASAAAPGADAASATAPAGPAVLLVVDGDPGSAALRESVARLAREGAAAGIHLLCLAETPPASPASPVAATIAAANAACSLFPECGTLALLSGDVATAVRLVHRTTGATEAEAVAAAAAPTGPVATADGVSAAWAERFARALAPLREPEDAAARAGAARPTVTLPRSCRLLDELGLARATPAALLARWSARGEETAGRAPLTFGAGPLGSVEADLAALRGHVSVTGGPGSGKTELLRSLAASLAAGERPDRLALVLLDGAGAEAGDGLRVCADLPHVTAHLAAGDPVRMRDFAQSLTAELKRRAELLGDRTYEEYARTASRPRGRVVAAREAPERAAHVPRQASPVRAQEGAGPEVRGEPSAGAGAALGEGEQDTTRRTLRLRPRQETPPEPGSGSGAGNAGGAGGAGTGVGGRTGDAAGPVFPRIAVVVDDFDTLVDPALGNPGRPASGSVVRAMEAVAREGARLGVHLIAASGRAERTEGSPVARLAVLRAELTGGEAGAGAEAEPPGRGTLTVAEPPGAETGTRSAETGTAALSGVVPGAGRGAVTSFQAGRVTGRIPRTATLRPTVVPLDWSRVGDPPTRRQVRELGNGPTDLALLASAIERAAKSLGVPSPTGPATPGRSRSDQEEAADT